LTRPKSFQIHDFGLPIIDTDGNAFQIDDFRFQIGGADDNGGDDG
jgi:hypothetical protein